MIDRKKTREIRIGNVYIGGNHPIRVQSMTKTDTRNVPATIRQIKRLEKVGCEIVRLAVPDLESARALREIKKRVDIPLVADIHFNFRLALEAISSGVDKIRINPGNIGGVEKVGIVARAAKKARIPIRIGVNAGSISLPQEETGEKKDFAVGISKKASCMVRLALEYIKMLENERFDQIVVSLKASDVRTTISAYRLISKKIDYPLHLGITEAGSNFSGTIKSSIGMGVLLAEGIGDTIRVSLTAPPEEEVRVGYEILQSLGLRYHLPEIVSCPTCGRCQINLAKIVTTVEKKIQSLIHQRKLTFTNRPLKVAIMGCIVNGPGEACDADIGIAGGKGVALLFRKGKVLRKIREEEAINVLIEELEKETRR